MKKSILIVTVSAIIFFSCNNKIENQEKTETIYPAGSFGYDLNFLQKHDSIIILKSGNSQIIVSPKYQAKVFTSTAEGLHGASFGWIHYKAFEGSLDAHMNGYGGENRIWVGPEGGKFSLFFPKDAKMEFANWKAPAAFDSEPWKVISRSDSSAFLQKDMVLKNYAGTLLNLSVERRIKIIENINNLLQIENDTSVKSVGYGTENTLINTGANEWNETTGMPCIWLLDMFNPSEHTTIVIPYKNIDDAKPATTDYFGEIPADRIKFNNDILFFKADGKMRGKLGIHPAAAKNIIGSYDAVHNILTVTIFDSVSNGGRYLNQEWKTNKAPFSGDAVNAYNDGPLATGGQLGPFYELESVSPAAFLKPGEKLIHHHSVFHFAGPEKNLDAIAVKLLGVSLSVIKNIF
jgi:hypothetical protein